MHSYLSSTRGHFANRHYQSNGGTVVPLDKTADIMIADHARKDAPNGSYSWTFIEESVKSGQLADKHEHLISRPAAGKAPGPNATAGQTRGTRTPFTAEDDAFLIKWVLTNRHKHKPSGNKMYQDLANEVGSSLASSEMVMTDGLLE